MAKSLAEMREEYGRSAFDEGTALADPVEQFAVWFEQAVQTRPGPWFEPNAMTLATASLEGAVSARIMLLKDFSERGFTFFTNYGSRKAEQLSGNPQAAMVFHWSPLERQVRIEGRIARTSREESLAYFRTRPRASQLGALLSQQSRVVGSRDELDAAMAALEREYDGREVPLPDNWGGYRLEPTLFEFWQGRASRLHDRLRYTQQGGAWVIDRLSP